MKNNYSDFFEHILKFKEKQTKQKQRGLNDFNLLSTVRKYHDEVYLHSTMIGALLSPDGLYYQDTLRYKLSCFFKVKLLLTKLSQKNYKIRRLKEN